MTEQKKTKRMKNQKFKKPIASRNGANVFSFAAMAVQSRREGAPVGRKTRFSRKKTVFASCSVRQRTGRVVQGSFAPAHTYSAVEQTRPMHEEALPNEIAMDAIGSLAHTHKKKFAPVAQFSSSSLFGDDAKKNDFHFCLPALDD